MNENYIEQCIIRTALESKDFLSTISLVFIPEYFNDSNASDIFSFLCEHIKEYKDIPDKSVIINSTKSPDDVKKYLSEVESIEYDVAKNYSWLFDKTNELLKDRALKKAVMDVVDLIEKKEDPVGSRKLIESALCKDLKVDLGLDYWADMQSRLTKIITSDDNRIPTYYPHLDECLNGGFPPKTLSVFVARIFGFKSQMMANIAARQVLHGHNVALASLEMSEDMFAQRFDGIYSCLDINRLYYNTKVRKEFLKRIAAVRKQGNKGNLYIKEYPTGGATINDFRIWLRELEIRGKKPDIFYFDYISLVKVMKERGLYEDKKGVAEEARALGKEFNIPVVSVSQLNREGTFIPLEDVDFNFIQESIGIAATADMITILGNSMDNTIYESELHYKIVKNRLGGRAGTMDKFFYDQRSLKIYDSMELSLWVEEAKLTGDTRDGIKGDKKKKKDKK